MKSLPLLIISLLFVHTVLQGMGAISPSIVKQYYTLNSEKMRKADEYIKARNKFITFKHTYSQHHELPSLGPDSVEALCTSANPTTTTKMETIETPYP